MNKSFTWLVVGVIIVGIGFIWWGSTLKNQKISSAVATSSVTVSDPSVLAGMQTTQGLWDPEIPHLKERLDAIGLPALAAEAFTQHIHQHLDIFIDGKAVAVPAGIGINESAGFISEIHTHDSTGVIHVEAPTLQTFTLGQFFDIYGVKLTADCVGGYCNTDGKTLKVFINGAATSTDPRLVPLTAHEEIALTYGTDTEVPSSIPSSYDFPAGE